MNIKHMVREIDETIDFLMTCNLDDLETPVDIIVCGVDENREAIGIHLIEPNAEEIERQWQDAHYSAPTTVWCHYHGVKQFKRKAK